MSCCHGDEYGDIFTSREARRAAARFRRRGLTGSARRLATAMSALLAPADRIVEVGGGVGAIHVILLESEATATAVNVDLSSSWDEPASVLLEERRLSDRARRIVGDFVDEAPVMGPADMVVLHRVICCYPDWKKMIDVAANMANRVVGMTVPVDRAWNKWAISIGNLLMRSRRLRFRAYVHSPEAMIARLDDYGWAVSLDHRGLIWRTVVAQRTAG